MLPKYQTKFAAGLDLPALTSAELMPGETVLVETGIRLQDLLSEDDHKFLEKLSGEGFVLEAQVRPRSGLAAKHRLTVLNSPGTIDFDYADTIKVILVNHGWQIYDVKEGERIAQLVFGLVYRPKHLLSDQERVGGFGSTGS